MTTEALEELLEARLRGLAARDLLRTRDAQVRAQAAAAARRLGSDVLDLSSNDYLGLASLPLGAATDSAGGAGASRLIHGTRDAHSTLERALAEWLGAEDALLFSSGYAANVGVVSALAAPGDLILSDALNHASLIDGCRLSRAEVVVLPHRDLGTLEAELRKAGSRTTWVLTEALFSMDGTQCDFAGVADILRTAPAAFLVADEAHSLGVYGPAGRGLAALAGCTPDVLIGTFGKAFGLHGAFVAGSRRLCSWLWNKARSFVYSTATSPALAHAALERLPRVIDAEFSRRRLLDLSAEFHQELEARFPGRRPPGAEGPIVPLLLGSEATTLAAAQSLLGRGILTQAIRPPTVPPGTARLRMTLKASHSASDVARALAALGEVVVPPGRAP